MHFQSVDTISDLSEVDMKCRTYMARNKPLLMKGAAKEWDACKKWSFDYFKDGDLGSTQVDISLDHKEGGKKLRQTLREYILSIEDFKFSEKGRTPEEESKNSDDDCASKKELTEPGQSTDFLPYLRAWYFSEEQGHLLDDFPNPPKSFPDKFKRLDKDFQPPFTWIFIGPEGAYSPLHRDIWFTCAWMAQIVGRKRFVFFPPSDLKHVYRKVVSRALNSCVLDGSSRMFAG
jgi:histone arginine demethylase JMJD6